MTRAWFLGLLVFVLLAVGLASLRGVELALAIPFLLYWMYALWRTRDSIQLVVHRELSPEQVVPGEPVVVKVRISNAGGDLEELAVQDALPSGLEIVHGSSRHLIPLAAGKNFQFAYTVRGPRGGYPFGALHAEAGDSLGLLRRASDFDAPARLMVMPAVSRVRPVPIRPRRTRVYAGSIPARVGGPGTEFFGVRPYEVGDPARRINWRAVARHPDSVFSNEFQQERVADVAVILDGRQRTDLRYADRSLFEHSVVAAGSLASSLLQQGNRVGLLIYSHYLRWTFPGYGKLQRERILHALAAAAPGASQVFEGLQYLPTRLFPFESQIVLVSPLLEDDLSTLVQLRARGYQVLVICPDPVSFEVQSLPRPRSRITLADVELAARIVKLERSVMLGRLRRAGVQVVEWDVAQPFDRMMHGAFRRIGRQHP
ncbi:MAG TPA: DUF58 domain-containing protein [Anaerolineales bacterium]